MSVDLASHNEQLDHDVVVIGGGIAVGWPPAARRGLAHGSR